MKIAIIHALPLEYYPPAMNMIDFLSQNKISTRVFTYKNNKNLEEYQNSNSKIYRSSFPVQSENVLKRLFRYFYFNLATLFRLIRFRPELILYYEPHSAWPGYWYLKLLGKNTRLFIHNHEYYPEEHFNSRGMRLVKLNHCYEKKYLYKRACWISQTNEKRKQLFLSENGGCLQKKLRVLPNYPPRSWIPKIESASKNKTKNEVIRMVYVGSLSLADTYVKEICGWVTQQNNLVQLDVFSFNLHPGTEAFFAGLNERVIRFYKNGIAYHDLPRILPSYDIGLILYKCNTINYVYNATNKLFEYLVCGLSVWFPEEMKGAHDFIDEKGAQKVVGIDFKKLNGQDVKKYIPQKNAWQFKEIYCEDVFSDLLAEFNQPKT